ncbi:MAG: HAD-IA family hydrolase [Verrucomicrobiae bacterium]|nr:HAD-IA family hydrolase [Verrucomicrobiae bacterium]
MINGIIFDMDGVLCDSEPFISEAAVRMFRETYGVAVQHADFLPFVGTGENRFIGGVAEKYGVSVQIERDKARVYAIYLEIIRGRLEPLPGVLTFVQSCRTRGLKLAVATSADRIKMDGNLAQIGLPVSSFDVVVTGSDIAKKKPDPEIFLTAAQRMGLPNSACLVIEDAVSGVKAGVAAGSPCLGITTSYPAEALREVGAKWTAPDLAHFPAGIL